ncbi:MAG TPA: hypothetical protein VLB50_01150, partial [Ignavibacteriaceae bacterium]|nr:hypothetical protein [Ignavibacteriaceae bacterium]
SGEAIDIRPEPVEGQLTFKWNWDTPLLISPHSHTRLYCAANKVFRSDDRGDTWQEISPDLTAQLDRNQWPVMGKYWSVDAVSKDKSTSLFGTIVSLSESPVKENLLYAGTDDGVIQISEDAKNWKKIDEFPGVPQYTYVSDICPSSLDENIVFVSFNNLQRDDFKPYILKSTDKGSSWESISGNLPENGSVHTIQQDLVNPDLLFAGTEFGFFFTTDGGNVWTQLKSGLPTIAVKDIAIQKKENDLVIATFGRGFYILDNFTPLRELNKTNLDKEAYIFSVKEALLYHQTGGRYGQGSNYFRAPNPDFGAEFTYYIKDVPKTLQESRREKERELFKDGKPIPQPDDAELRVEKEEIEPYLVFTIKDDAGNVIRKLTKAAAKGINRINWDLRYENTNPVEVTDKFNPVREDHGSTLALPGKYTVTMAMINRSGEKLLYGPVDFDVRALNNSTLPIADRSELVKFQENVNKLAGTVRGTERFLDNMMNRVIDIKQALINTPAAPNDLMVRAENLWKKLKDISLMFNRESNFPSTEENPPSQVTFNERLGVLAYTHYRSSSNITQNEKNAYKILLDKFPPVLEQLKNLYDTDLKSLEDDMEKYDAPWTPGRIPTLDIN